MWEHAKQATTETIHSSGGEVWGVGKEPYTPGWSLHETGTLRMGDDPKRFVTNRFGQAHDVKNLFVCDASVFLGCSDKTTTLSILAFSLRTSEHVVERFKKGEV
jgi:choline dehydrogenase-like flavoprotein